MYRTKQKLKDEIREVSFEVPTFNQRFTWIGIQLFAAAYLGFVTRVVWPSLQSYPMRQFSVFVILTLPVAVVASQCWICYRIAIVAIRSGKHSCG